jgi:hypothetical protein
MKHIYLFFALFFATTLFAQIPQGFSYQAVALNASGNAVASSPVKVRLSILDNSATGTAVYTETHNPSTNNMGLFTLTIGQGTPLSGTFAGINWGTNSKFLKVEIDIANGTNYITIGSSQLLAVPYAMYAGAVAGMGGTTGTMLNQLYLYGSFNSFNAGTALQMPAYATYEKFVAYKYFTAGTQLKFLPALNSPIAYGNTGSNELGTNGSNFVVNSAGLYKIIVSTYGEDAPYTAHFGSIAPKVIMPGASSTVNMTYNAGTNILSAIVNVPASIEPQYRYFRFEISNSYQFGDNLANGTIEMDGADIYFPGTGNYKIELNLNFTGEGSTYAVTPI